MNKQYDVFISYARRDYLQKSLGSTKIIPNNPILRIMNRFKENNISFWYDKKGVSGKAFRTIKDKIDKSRVMIFVSSEASNNSTYTQDEIYYAKRKDVDVPIIVFNIDQTPYNSDFVLGLSSCNQIITFPTNQEQALDELIDSVNASLQEEYEKEQKIKEEKEREEKNRKEEERRNNEILLAKISEKEKELTEKRNRLHKIATEIAAAKITIKTLSQERREIKSNILKIEQDLKTLHSDNLSTSPVSFMERFKQKLHSFGKTIGMALVLVVLLVVAVNKCSSEPKDEPNQQMTNDSLSMITNLEPKFIVIEVTHSDSIQFGKRRGVIMHLSYKVENVNDIEDNPYNIGIYFCTKDGKPINTNDKDFQFVEDSKQLSYSSPDLTSPQQTIHIFIPKSALSSPDNVKCDIVMFLGGIEYKSQEKFYTL